MSPLKSMRCYYTLSVTLVILFIALTLLGEPSSFLVHVSQDKQICEPDEICATFRLAASEHLLQAHVKEELNLQNRNNRFLSQFSQHDDDTQSFPPQNHDIAGLHEMDTILSKLGTEQTGVSEKHKDPLKAVKRLYLPKTKESSKDVQPGSAIPFQGSPPKRPIFKGDEHSYPKADLKRLTRMLKDKLKAAQIEETQLGARCDSKNVTANSCDGSENTCLRKELPEDLEARVSQLVTPAKLQIDRHIQNALHQMAQKVVGYYDIILASAASFNHYLESQAMIKNAHEYFFPAIKNFTFIFYNLGLSEKQRRSLSKNCKCQVLDFPFDEFPQFIRNLSCYSWKPLIIKAHAHQANVLIWADASIRFHTDPNHLHTIINQARKRGIQTGITPTPSPFRTFRNMYHFFGDEPCAYLGMQQAMATTGFYGRDYFVDRAILDPWVGCAVRQECMCSLNGLRFSEAKSCTKSGNMERDWLSHNGTISYGLCHRFDQSAISLIVHKLYQGYYQWIMVKALRFVSIRRGDKLKYFPTE